MMGEKSKWFEPKEKEPPPVLRWVPSGDYTEEALESLFVAMKVRKVSPRTFGLFKERVLMEPRIRLAVNLKGMLGLAAQGLLGGTDSQDLVAGVLNHDEQLALAELMEADFDLTQQSTAWCLLDMNKRRAFADVIRDTFAGVGAARAPRDHFLDQLFKP